MTAKSVSGLLGAVAAGAIFGTVLWFVVNSCFTVNGVGWLVRLGLPWLNVYTVAAGFALVCLAAVSIHRLRQAEHARRLVDIAPMLGFTYQPAVTRQELDDYQGLQLLQKWSEASNRLSGQADGVAVEMVDYTSVETGDDGSNYQTQTVVLLPVAGLPCFELRARDWTMRFLAVLGLEGITFRPGDAAAGPERTLVDRFGKLYFLSVGLEAMVKAGVTRTPTPASEEADQAIRRAFSLDVLCYLAEHPGWNVECDGRHLALWRRGKVVAARDRPGFLAGALAVRQALTTPGTRLAEAGAVVPGGTSGVDPHKITARLQVTVVGFFAGCFIGSAVALGPMMLGLIDPFGPHGFLLSSVTFFGGFFGGIALGGFLANRLLYYPLYHRVRRRAQERAQAETKA
jgi:hypothetical protein